MFIYGSDENFVFIAKIVSDKLSVFYSKNIQTKYFKKMIKFYPVISLRKLQKE